MVTDLARSFEDAGRSPHIILHDIDRRRPYGRGRILAATDPIWRRATPSPHRKRRVSSLATLIALRDTRRDRRRNSRRALYAGARPWGRPWRRWLEPAFIFSKNTHAAVDFPRQASIG